MKNIVKTTLLLTLLGGHASFSMEKQIPMEEIDMRQKSHLLYKEGCKLLQTYTETKEEKTFLQAKEKFKAAIALGDPNAAFTLASIYYNTNSEIFSRLDSNKALKYFHIAKKLGLTQAESAIQDIQKKLEFFRNNEKN